MTLQEFQKKYFVDSRVVAGDLIVSTYITAKYQVSEAEVFRHRSASNEMVKRALVQMYLDMNLKVLHAMADLETVK